ncbi:hypothetical protein CHS0354_026619 [Potamilus streckersoni]|uniref:Uncharacterized protein n=1 Tax=Potamilus streckersoni TaxID=2493646 RepID=A0AAE0VVT2_9BIVA|nr:hypothetical protein CHS0354_026619 [Potamilus streckersoni]
MTTMLICKQINSDYWLLQIKNHSYHIISYMKVMAKNIMTEQKIFHTFVRCVRDFQPIESCHKIREVNKINQNLLVCARYIYIYKKNTNHMANNNPFKRTGSTKGSRVSGIN